MPAGPYEEVLHEGLASTLREAGDYFAGGGRLHATVRRLAARLAEHGISYALVGGMALGEHGYVRMTEDVDLLLTPEGLASFRARFEGRGYVGTYPGATRAFRDVETGVRVEVLVTGEFPGDGRPKPVAFPDPKTASIEVDGVKVLALPRLIDLKLASGTTAPSRLRDLADVQEMIKARQLDEQFAEQLDPSLRRAYLKLHHATRATQG